MRKGIKKANRIKLLLFMAYKKTDRKEVYQGIIYPDGKVKMGYDLWRDLDPVDMATYTESFRYYPSLAHVTRDFIYMQIEKDTFIKTKWIQKRYHRKLKKEA